MQKVVAGICFAVGLVSVRAATLCDAYVQDGLVAFWDGVYNQGADAAHDGSAATWVDVTGHGYALGPYLAYAQPTWCDDGCVFPDAARTTCTALGCTTGAQLLPGGTAPFTLEFIADAPVVSTLQAGIVTLTASKLTGSISHDIDVRTAETQIYTRYYGSAQQATDFRPANQTNPGNGSFSVALTRTAAGNVYWHYQASLFATLATGSTTSCAAVSNVVIGATYDTSAYGAGFTGTVHAVRIYSRALTDAERKRNHKLDLQRFHGGEALARVTDGTLEWRMSATVSSGSGTVSVAGGDAGASAEGWFAATGDAVAFVATPASGYAFSCWSGDTDGLTDEQLASSTLSVPRGIYRCLYATFMEDAGYHAADYVQDGLLAHYDALENAGARRRAADPDTWADLSGNGQTATAGSGAKRPSWTSNAACPTNASGKQAGFSFTPCAEFLSVVNGKKPFTLQYCATSPTIGNGTYVFGLGSGSTFGFRYTDTAGTAYFQNCGSQTGIGKQADALSGKTDSIFFSGATLYRSIDKTYKAYYTANLGTGTVTGGGYILYPAVNTVMNLHAVRFYDRLLTPYEIAHNARLDRVRFKGDADATRILGVRAEPGRQIGTSTPAYVAQTTGTAYEYDAGTEVAMSLATLVTDDFDGVRKVDLGTGVRGHFYGWRTNGGVTNATESTTLTLNADTDFAWVIEREYLQRYSAGTGGEISVNGAEGAASYAAYVAEGASVTLAAVPDEGYAFLGWAGTLTGLAGHETDLSITVPVNRVRTLKAIFKETAHTPTTVTWTGGSTTDAKDWDDPANWGGQLPDEGDTVIFADSSSARTVYLAHPTPPFAALTIGAKTTLMTSNWYTKISATTVTVKKNGILTSGNAFGTYEMSNRVWVACTDFDLQTGASVALTGKGFLPGQGPGAACGYCGASHGGYGSKYYATSSKNRLPYDDPENPQIPGSGGSAKSKGGGAFLLEATGTVTLNGTVEASAEQVGMTAYSDGYASGGSICIRSNRFKSSGGALYALGTYSGSNWWAAESGNNSCYPGAGGCISVKWSPASEEEADVSNLKISARGAYMYFRENGGGTSWYRSPTLDDAWHQEADLGTLWFTDSYLVKKCISANLAGNVVHPAQFDFDDLAMTAGHVRFSAEGAQVNVSGDLTLSGICTRLEIGGRYAEMRYTFADAYSVLPWRFTVGGDMTVSGGARFDARSASTADSDAAGGLVSVKGKLSLLGHKAAKEKDTSWHLNGYTTSGPSSIYAHSDRFSGVSARFDVGSLLVESNALFTAARMGYTSGYSEHPSGCGPGGGVGSSSCTMMTGGGHGGLGGNWQYGGGGTNDYGGTFGVLRPSIAGSGGSGRPAAYCSGNGGGVIRIRAAKDVCVNGTVSANGEDSPKPHIGGGAGGTILIDCKRFSGNANGVLTACGGATTQRENDKIPGGGGGGRIAVWTGRLFDDAKTKPRYCIVATNAASFAGAVRVAGGDSVGGAEYDGGAGTAYFVTQRSVGFQLLVK